MTDGPPARAASVLAEVNRDLGTAYTLTAQLTGGFQGGAWRITAPDGTSSVLKFAPDRGSWSQVVRAAECKTAAARCHGYPTPPWFAAGVTPTGFVYQIHGFVPAAHRPDRLAVPLAVQLIDVLERCAAGFPPPPCGDPRSDWSRFVHEQMGSDADSVTARVSALGPSAAAAVARALSLLSRHPSTTRLPVTDLVHGDFNLGNILVAPDGRLAAFIDVEALGAGTRAHDYATLWHSAGDNGDREALRLVRAAGERAAGVGGFTLCAVWCALEYISFGAGIDGAAGVERAVAAAHRRFDRLEAELC